MLGAEDDDLDDSVLGELVTPLEDGGDDDLASGVEGEFEIDEPPELAPEQELELDTGGALDEVPDMPEQGFADDDAALGLDDVEPAAELDAFAPLEDGDGPDGPDEPLPRLHLPELDSTLGDEVEARQTTSELPLASSIGDEQVPAPAERGFTELLPELGVEACGALALAQGTALAASTDLLWFARGESSPLRLEAGGTRIHAVALVGEGRELALCSTSSGRLLRRGRSQSAPEELRAPRPLPDARALREPLDLHQPEPADSRRVVARTASGLLLASDDDGATYERISATRAVSLAGGGAPIAALSEHARLLLSGDGGRSFAELPLAGLAREIAKGQRAMVSASRDVVVLGSPELGVAFSSDGGRSFSRVPGTRGVTAVEAAHDDGGARIFVALESEGYDRSLLVEIEPASGEARAIAVIQAEPDEEGAERVRVARLIWDGAQSRLWVAGAFGVRLYAPPLLAL